MVERFPDAGRILSTDLRDFGVYRRISRPEVALTARFVRAPLEIAAIWFYTFMHADNRRSAG